jgi:glycerophosphoryl diester phosphodiesterase
MKRIIVSILAFAALAFAAEGRKVTGSVTCGDSGIAGVTVTDGKSFTQTRPNGKFSFEIADDAEHVFIITPAGYVAEWSSGVPQFYMDADGKDKFNFSLQRTQGGHDYNIIAVSDPQVYSDEQFAIFAGKPIQDMTKTAASLTGTTVGIALGDISWDRIEVLDMYKKEIVRTGIPFYPVVGNHDYEAYVQGDKEAAATYRSKMGPENYAFYLGKDIVIILDNIIYDTNFKMTAGYTSEVIAWVKELMKTVPAEAEVFVAQHTTLGRGQRRIKNASTLLEILRGRKVTILSGHTHINSINNIEKNVTEHNVGAICGAWWDTMHCTDGTPRGYKVLTKHAGKLTWYYKPVDYSRKHIAEAYAIGTTRLHPNSIVVNVWDWDEAWKVEWYEDGVHMGSMDKVAEVSPVFAKEIQEAYAGQEIPGWKSARPSAHNFAATPSRYAKSVTVTVESRFGQKWTETLDVAGYVEKHMCCYPTDVTVENAATLVDKGATFLKFDVVTDINGKVTAGTKNGPTITELIDAVEEYVEKSRRSAVGFNLEMHTAAGKEEGKTVPYYHDHVDYIMADLWGRYMGQRLMVTGSDYRSLNHMNEKYPEVDLAFKVEKGTEDAEKAMKRLKFTPKWISFHYTDINEAIIKKYHDKGMYVSAWGIDNQETAEHLSASSIDALIY